jgi:DNA repair protein RecO (recombination protein O)
MFLNYRTQGLILKKEDRGEADRLFTIYTKDFGKLAILGRGIRKISSKLRGGAEVFYLSEIEFIQGKAQKTLTDAVLIESFNNLRQNLNRLKVAQLVAKAADSALVAPEADPKIWDLLCKVFKKINDSKAGPEDSKEIYKYFLANFKTCLGI